MAPEQTVLDGNQVPILLRTQARLTPELQEVFCQLVSLGNYYKACCNAVGIAYETFNLWMRYGRASDNPNDIYRQFYLNVRQADARAEIYAAKMWRSHFENDYRAARDFLARRHPERWGSKHMVAVAVDREMEKVLGTLRGSLSGEEYSKVLRALAGGGDTESDDVIELDSLIDEEAAFSFIPLSSSETDDGSTEPDPTSGT